MAARPSCLYLRTWGMTCGAVDGMMLAKGGAKDEQGNFIPRECAHAQKYRRPCAKVEYDQKGRYRAGRGLLRSEAPRRRGPPHSRKIIWRVEAKRVSGSDGLPHPQDVPAVLGEASRDDAL